MTNEGVPGAPDDDPSGRRPGAGIFTIEGRAAPGLFVVGWLATILGAGVAFVGWQAGERGPGVVLVVAGLALLSIGLVAGAGSQAIERRSRGHEPYTGPSPVLVLAAAIPVAALGAVLLGGVLTVLDLEPPQAAVDLGFISIQVAVYLALVRLLVVGTGALSWREIGFRGRASEALGDLAWGAALAAPAIVATVALSWILVAILGVVPEAPLPPTGEAGGLVLHLLAAAVLVPVGEEVLFRGVATTAWARSLGANRAILRGALFFALAHILFLGGSTFGEAVGVAIIGFASRLPVALVLGWVFLRRRSIWPAIGLHAAFNGILLTLSELAAGAPPA